MSIRFHRAAPLITLFHDPSSTSSKRAFDLLTRFANPLSQPYNLEQIPHQPPPPIQLEIIDRNVSPPTRDQLSSILPYLAPHLQQHNSNQSILLQSGLLIVNWDSGFATNNLDDLKQMIQQIQQQQTDSKSQKENPHSCIVS